MSDEAVVVLRVLYLSGYSRPEQHRKIELLADALDVTILNIDGPACDRNAGILPSANGKRQYVHQIVPTVQIGNAGDVHRFVHWPPRIALRTFKPNLIYCEHEQESLVAAEICLLRNMFAPRTPLILYAWQNIVRPRHLPVRLLSQFTLASAQHIVCASSEGIEVLRKQGYHRGASIVPQSGVDTRQFQDKSSALLRASLGLDGFVVGYVGRLVPEKGVDLLLRAAATITTKPRVLIVGDGPSRAALQALAAQLDISERCHFVGFVSPGNIADYYSVMDVLVLPSRTQVHWKEQFGRVLTEGMACGVPVIGSDSGAIPEVVGNGGLIFAEEDWPALAAAIDRLANDARLRKSIGVLARQRVIEEYTVEKLAAHLLDVWRAVVSDTRDGHMRSPNATRNFR